ncbi:flagellar protein required for flagellar formation, partial [Kingella potus]
MQNQSVTSQLREELFTTLRGLKDGSVNIETAHAVSKISSNIISTVVVEIQAAQTVGADKISSINGLDARQIRGGVV